MQRAQPLALPLPTAAPTAALALPRRHCRLYCHSRTACLTCHILRQARGVGSGANKWLIFQEGKAWCLSPELCLSRTKATDGRGGARGPTEKITFGIHILAIHGSILLGTLGGRGKGYSVAVDLIKTATYPRE